MNFRTFNADRPFIERKYHDPDQPFDPYKRMGYHGWECPAETGLSVEEISAGLLDVAAKYADASHEIRKARAVEYVLDHTRIDLGEHDYFPLIYTWNREIKKTTVSVWKKEVFAEKVPEIKEAYDLFNASGAAAIWPDFDHVVPDWSAILSLGFAGLKDRAADYRQRLATAQNGLDDAQTAYFDGIEIEYAAVLRFLARLAALAAAKTHEKADVCARALAHIATGAPANTLEAMLTIYLYFFISESVDHYQVRSLGNGLDATLFPFYQKDLQNGTFTRDEIKEFLAYFFLQWSAIGNYWGQPFYLGGTALDGNTKINALSYDIIEVYSHLGIYNPKIQIKYNDNLPQEFLDRILSDVRRNRGSYVFCCEPGMIKAVMNYGATYEEAHDFDIRGCYETGVRANEVSAAGGYINMPKAVEYVFSDGFDRGVGEQVGPHTGDVTAFCSFEDFYAAFLAQWSYLIETTLWIVGSYEAYLGYINPSSLYSATIETSLRQGKDGYQNGVKFNNSAELCCGFATAVDALMAVKTLVFEQKTATLAELKKALDANWVGFEKLRLAAQKCPHKYGNGDEAADRFATALATYFATKVGNRPNARGGVYKPIMHTAMQFVWEGKKTQATPDGRRVGEEFSKNASPAVGADRNGATALVLSAVRLRPTLFTESFCLDVMPHPSAVAGEDGLGAMKGLLDVYLKNDGQSLQFNVFNADTLRDAQVHPEKYRNLQVRVCGWNVLWNDLSRAEQDAYIARTAAVVGD